MRLPQRTTVPAVSSFSSALTSPLSDCLLCNVGGRLPLVLDVASLCLPTSVCIVGWRKPHSESTSVLGTYSVQICW